MKEKREIGQWNSNDAKAHTLSSTNSVSVDKNLCADKLVIKCDQK
jgi:hypothetical protein